MSNLSEIISYIPKKYKSELQKGLVDHVLITSKENPNYVYSVKIYKIGREYQLQFYSAYIGNNKEYISLNIKESAPHFVAMIESTIKIWLDQKVAKIQHIAGKL